MTRQQLRATVAEMRRKRRARGDRVGNLLRRRIGMADRDAYAGVDQVLDEWQRRPAILARA